VYGAAQDGIWASYFRYQSTWQYWQTWVGVLASNRLLHLIHWFPNLKSRNHALKAPKTNNKPQGNKKNGKRQNEN
jgi:hypothetical protein